MIFALRSIREQSHIRLARIVSDVYCVYHSVSVSDPVSVSDTRNVRPVSVNSHGNNITKKKITLKPIISVTIIINDVSFKSTRFDNGCN